MQSYKLILIGDPSVGKTSLRKRYMGEGFKTNHQVTIGADFAVKRFVLNEEKYLFQIWDLSSQIAFKSIRQIYYKNTDGLILTFALDSESSLDNIPLWVREFTSNVYHYRIPGILVGNKSDLIASVPDKVRAKVNTTLELIAKNFGQEYKYIETSALNGDNVDLMFNSLIKSILANKQMN